ncbi:hypothetical protein PMAYCL1PPCAC_19323, partial [Pristionchus mayeri]
VTRFTCEFSVERLARPEFYVIAENIYGLPECIGRYYGPNQLITRKANCEVACIGRYSLPFGLQMKVGAWRLMIHERPNGVSENPRYCFSVYTGTGYTMNAQCQ